MSLIFEKRSGNSYTINDGVIEVNAELLGGGDGMLIMLHSIKAAAPATVEASNGSEDLIAYLAQEIERQKGFGKFVIIHKGKVVFSLDKGLQEGAQVSTEIKQKT